MTLDEAATHGDISIFYIGEEDEDNDWQKGWRWDLNCGYQSWGGSISHETPNEAMESLIEFLKTWTGPTK